MEKVVLYGAGTEGEKWYVRWHQKYEIEYVLDNSGKRDFHGIPVYKLDEKKEELHGHKIVIAMSLDKYHDVAQSLIELGEIEGEDFLWMEQLNRKLMILYGNCHVSILKEYFMNNPILVREYAIMHFCVNYDNVNIKYPRIGLLKSCDILIMPDIREENKLNVPGVEQLIERLNPNARMCIYPNLYGYNFFYPQVIENDENVNEKHMRNVNHDIANILPMQRGIIWQLQGLRDGNIDKMYKENKTVDEMIICMEDADTYDEMSIKMEFEKTINNLRIREHACDINISEFIMENFRNIQLYYEPYHPTNILLCELGRRILKFLNIKIIENVPVAGCLSGGEIFIYESVRKALGLNFKQDFVRIDYEHRACTLENFPMNKREYIINYIAWNYGEVLE